METDNEISYVRACYFGLILPHLSEKGILPKLHKHILAVK